MSILHVIVTASLDQLDAQIRAVDSEIESKKAWLNTSKDRISSGQYVNFEKRIKVLQEARETLFSVRRARLMAGMSGKPIE